MTDDGYEVTNRIGDNDILLVFAARHVNKESTVLRLVRSLKCPIAATRFLLYNSQL